MLAPMHLVYLYMNANRSNLLSFWRGKSPVSNAQISTGATIRPGTVPDNGRSWSPAPHGEERGLAKELHHDRESVRRKQSPTYSQPFGREANMSVIATIAVESDQFELGQILHTDHDMRVDLTQFVPIEGMLAPYFWVEDDGNEAFEEEVRSDPRVKKLTALNGVVGHTLYHIEWEQGIDGLLDTLAEHEILVERGVGTDSTWVFRLRSDNRETLSRFQNGCVEKGITVEIRRVIDNPEDPETNQFELTPKQHEAVMLALEEGYFDIPREASLTNLADIVGISRQAFSRRLNRGLRSLLMNTVGRERESKPGLQPPDG